MVDFICSIDINMKGRITGDPKDEFINGRDVEGVFIQLGESTSKQRFDYYSSFICPGCWDFLYRWNIWNAVVFLMLPLCY